MKISVIIPCFKSGNYVLEAVNSVLAQKGESNLLEVIVVDDHNDDVDTLNALNKLKAEYPDNVKVFQNIGDRGPGAARNVGIEYAKGDWIAFLDADDKYCEHALDTMSKVSNENADCGWVGADFSIWYDSDDSMEGSFFKNRPITYKILKEAYQNNKPILFKKPIKEFIETALTHTISNMVKKELLDKVGGYDNSLRLQQDYNLYLKLALLSDFAFVPEICAFYRQHESNSTKSELNTLEWRIVAIKKVMGLEGFRAYRSHLHKKMSSIYTDISYDYRKNRRFLKSMQNALMAIKTDFLNYQGWKCFCASIIFR